MRGCSTGQDSVTVPFGVGCVPVKALLPAGSWSRNCRQSLVVGFEIHELVPGFV